MLGGCSERSPISATACAATWRCCVLPDVIGRTWGERARPVDGARRSTAVLARGDCGVRQRRPGFVFMAEAYWDLEWTLSSRGSTTPTTRSLRPAAGQAPARPRPPARRPRIPAPVARFLENHDEPRAAAVFPPAVHHAAAVITLLLTGLRFLHEGQRTGRRLRASNHLRRRAPEPIDRELEAFFIRLLDVLRRPEARDGEWRLLEPPPAWDGNPTRERFIAFAWDGAGGRLLVAVNYGDSARPVPRPPPPADLGGREVPASRDLDDESSHASTRRAGTDLSTRGLYRGACRRAGCRVFEVMPAAASNP